MNDCIFCRIVRGELPCARVYEDDAVLAFMDIGPLVKGHTLVIPKAHHDPLTAVPPALLARQATPTRMGSSHDAHPAVGQQHR